MSARQTDTRAGGGRPALYVAAALLAAAAGFAAVYVSFGPAGNAPPVPSQTRTAAAPPANAPDARRSDGTLAGLARGQMAAFVVHGEPKALAAVSFLDGDGEERTLEDWRGQVVLLNLWATWCAPCRHEMPSLDRLKAAFEGQDFDVVAVSVDLGSADKPRAFLEEIGVRHLVLYHEPTAKLGPKLKAIGMPTTLLIDRQGREIGRLAGPAEWDSDEARALVAAALAAGS